MEYENLSNAFVVVYVQHDKGSVASRSTPIESIVKPSMFGLGPPNSAIYFCL